VPLSDHEQRMLAEIERALYADDPKFAASVRTTTLHSRYQRRIALAIFVVVLGLALLVVGVATPYVGLGVLGFVCMLGGALSAVSSVKRMRNGVAPSGRFRRDRLRSVGGTSTRPTRGKSSGGLGRRFHERWQRRWEDRWSDEG
jgi:hypothetical protein